MCIRDRVYPARVRLNGGAAERLMTSPVVVGSPMEAKGCSVVLSGSDTKPTEIYAVEGGALRQITHQNDTLMAELEIAPSEEVSFTSKDGTEVHGLLTKPVGYTAGSRVPLLLRIHGGPNSQDAHSFSTEKQDVYKRQHEFRRGCQRRYGDAHPNRLAEHRVGQGRRLHRRDFRRNACFKRRHACHCGTQRTPSVFRRDECDGSQARCV